MAINVPLNIRQKRKLIGVMKKAMTDRGWKVKDLAVATGYSERSIYRLSNLKMKSSRDCVYEVTRVLEINLEDLK